MTRLLLVLGVMLGGSTVHGDPCERLREEARAEATLLYAPRLQVEGAYVPAVIDPVDPSSVAGGGVQGRVALAISPVDMLRGRAIERVARAECRRATAASRAEEVLSAGLRVGELAAVTAELAVLDARGHEIDGLVGEAVARFERQRATIVEVYELRERRATLQVRIADLQHRKRMLEAFDEPVATATELDDLVKSYAGATIEADRARASVRGLAAWRFDVRGGLAAGDRTDWFAVATIGFSFGQPWQRAANRRAVTARARELGDARELAHRATRLGRAMRESVAALEVALQQLDQEVALLRAELDRLSSGEAATDTTRSLRARITITLIELEARRASVLAMAAARRPLAGARS